MSITAVIVGLFLLLALPVILSCVYLALATLLSQAIPAPERSTRTLRFDVIVPAHDEASVIARCIGSLHELDWPRDRFRVIVVADNCSDATAVIADAAGALVLERSDVHRRGKGYALEHAFRASQRDRWADAIAVIDADSEVSANLLEAFAARIEMGALAVQAHYGVLNPSAGWRPRLMAIAYGAFHVVRSRARERLRLSCGIRGNGWCVTRELLLAIPYGAFSLAEDLEYGIALGLHGFRVQYAHEATVVGEMVSGARSAGTQRRRWEEGRFALVRSHSSQLLRAAVRNRSALCLDLALDLLVPPLSQLALAVFALLLAALMLYRWHFATPLASALGCAAIVTVYVLRGWQLSGTGMRGLLDLARSPAFVLWKLIVMLRHRGSRVWLRTERESP